MDSPIILAIIGLIGTFIGAAGGVWASSIVGRRRERANTRKTTAEAKKTEQETEQSATKYWREQVKELTAEIHLIKADFKEFRLGAEKDREAFQRQAVTLFDKIDTMGVDLARANTQLEAANKTIGELRQEVKSGNVIIAELREQVTQLLVKLAEKKE